MQPSLPWETIDEIIKNMDGDLEAYRIAVALRRLHVRDFFFPKVAQSMDQASKNGNVGLLEHRKQLGCHGYDTKGAMANACYFNIDDTLQEWMGRLRSHRTMDDAKSKPWVVVRDWWKTSGLELNYYTEIAMDWASEEGRVDVLDWWKQSGLECKYTSFAMDRASQNGHIDALDWWKQSGLECKSSLYAMDWASWTGRVHVLEWWKQSDWECAPLLKSRSMERLPERMDGWI